METKLIIAGGFLGAGKTTLLRETAQRLLKKGLRVGLITNDQAPGLVDSKLLELNNLPVAEVSGSCFCCNFNGFIDAVRNIRRKTDADIIIAEPVGSCTDLSATIMQPLKQFFSKELTIAPLSVLTDPTRLRNILDGSLHPDAAYIFRKQLEESDIILINKTDLLQADELENLKQRTQALYPAATVMTVSALTGDGLDEWLNETMLSGRAAGSHLAEIDYDTYANGEAVLGWLNGTIAVNNGFHITDWDEYTLRLLSSLADQFDAAGYAVGHVKVITESVNSFTAGNLTGTRETLSIRGRAGSGTDAKVIINARVETSPETLNDIVRRTLDALAAEKYYYKVLAWRYLQPGRPKPTHRFNSVV
ncbi:MAG: cobalamin synthesis protein P47K [Tannerella sp.]|jgi:G3E family GTPase|nr:cobalamin synthesis protein P47K [Tannerella sp.]